MLKIVSIFLLFFVGCSAKPSKSDLPWEKHGELRINKGSRIIQYDDGTPFLWLGCTSWGMTEWLPREDVDFYLDDRKSKGMNVVQLCLFWGKRVDYPTKFTANPSNYYGFKAFKETRGFPDATKPAIVDGGSPENPNDYWDHVDYCLQAIKKRGMYAAIFPFWGRRYVNAVHQGQSKPVFTKNIIFQYGKFLGERYADEPNIIWVNGGDVQADAGGDYTGHYRKLAEGLVFGATGIEAVWNEPNKAWNTVFMTYHPDGSAMKNSSTWFQNDEWLDFNMIETYVSRDLIAAAIRQDLNLPPPKPTVLGEPNYEGITKKYRAGALQMRRQAYQSFFAGAAGFTYGGAFDAEGNGPLFSPSNHWKPLLNQEGASQMKYLRQFLEENEWWKWNPAKDVIAEGMNVGELEKLAVRKGNSIFVYFPENSPARLKVKKTKELKWYNTKNGKYSSGTINSKNQYSPPENWKDGILMLTIGNHSFMYSKK